MTSAQQTQGVISGVHGTHVFIEHAKHPTIYAHRDHLTFANPFIGLPVEFEIITRPEMRNPEARNVRPVAWSNTQRKKQETGEKSSGNRAA